MDKIYNKEKWFKTVLENMLEAVAVYRVINDGENFIFIYFNPAAEKIDSISKDAVMGKKVTDIFPKVKEFGLFDLFQKVYETGQPEHHTSRLYKDDRISGWRENYIFKLKEDMIVAIYIDRSKEKQFERQIEQMSKFPEENPNPVLRISRKGHIIYANSAATGILNSAESFENHSITEYLIIEAQEIYDQGSHEFIEFEANKKTYSFSVVPIEKNGYINLYGADVTKLRKMENYMAQTDKMNAIGRLAGNVAHDFNNILTVILGYSDLILQDTNITDKIKDMINQIHNSAEIGSKITSDLLTFSKREVHAPENINLNAILQENKALLLRYSSETIDLKYFLSDELWDIYGDPSKILQVLMNLIINAKDAITNSGKITIETKNISFNNDIDGRHYDFKPGDYVLVEVSDNGSGISKDVLTHIFEPFFTTKSKEKGTGLGLSIVYSIIKQMNGYIIPYSEVGYGTTFKIYLPRSNEQSIQKIEVCAKESFEIGEYSVIVVEDSEPIKNFIYESLKSFCLKVVTFGTKAETLKWMEKCKGGNYVLITDIMLPDGNGKEIAEEFKKIDVNAQVLYISGYPENVIFDKGVPKEPVNFLSKPFEQKQLIQKLDEILKQNKI